MGVKVVVGVGGRLQMGRPVQQNQAPPEGPPEAHQGHWWCATSARSPVGHPEDSTIVEM